MQLSRTAGGAVNDAGFTLIELLIVIAILGIIGLPLGNVIIGYLHSNAETEARLAESHDAQISASYLQQDVASVGVRDYTVPAPNPLLQSVEVNVAPTAGLYPCGAAGLPNAVLRLAWDDFGNGAAAPAIQVRVAYLVQTVGGQVQLHRLRCAGSAAVTSDTVLAHDLVGASVSCSTSCTGTGAGLPAAISLNLTIHDPASTAGNYLITLTGQRRQT